MTNERIARLETANADLEQDNEGLSRHTAFMERYRMRAAVLEAAARRYLRALDTHRSTRPSPTTRTAQEFADFANASDGLQDAEVALRGLVDGQPTSDDVIEPGHRPEGTRHALVAVGEVGHVEHTTDVADEPCSILHVYVPFDHYGWLVGEERTVSVTLIDAPAVAAENEQTTDA